MDGIASSGWTIISTDSSVEENAVVTKDTPAAVTSDDSHVEALPREIFLQLRATGDGSGLAMQTLEGRSPLGNLFRRQFEKAFHVLVVKRGIRNKLGLHEDIRHRARYLIGQHLDNTCGAKYEDQGDSEFEGYMYVLCRRNIEFACLQELRNRTKDDERLRKLVSKLDPADVSTTGHDVDVCRAFGIAVRVIAGFDTRLRTVMADMMEDIPVSETAERLGCSRRMVQHYRKQGIDQVRAAWEGDVIN